MADIFDNPEQIVWSDVNSRIGLVGKPDLLTNVGAINNSLYNLFRTPIGARGPIGQPEYGTNLPFILHEPLDYITANKIKIVIIQAIQRWEPRIYVDMKSTSVDIDRNNNAFKAVVRYTIVANNETGTGNYLFRRT